VKKDPDAFSPEKIWKPSLETKRGSKGKTSDVVMKKFFKDQLDKFILVDIPCAACVWLFRALTTACDVPGSDFRCCIETA
jgi:hypothetical protein